MSVHDCQEGLLKYMVTETLRTHMLSEGFSARQVIVDELVGDEMEGIQQV